MNHSATKKPSKKRTSLASGKREGLSGIGDLDTRVAIVKETASVIPFLIKTAVVCTIGYLVYRSYTNRFTKLKENPNFPQANISVTQAETRATAIASSLGWFSNSFETVANNLSGLNYNAFVRLYNAFGHQSGTLFSGDLNLIEYIKNQFSEDEVQQLSFLTNGVFFKNTTDYLTEVEKTAFKQLVQ